MSRVVSSARAQVGSALRVARSMLAGSMLAGSMLAGSMLAGSMLAGSMLAGSMLAGSMLAGSMLAAPMLAAPMLAGCADREEIFTGGRIENRCNGAIPVCGQQAACVLSTSQYIRGTFPGGARLIVRSEVDPARLIVRLLLIDQTFPGTEMQVRAFDTGCGDFDEEAFRDVDIFAMAGDDGVLEYHLDVEGRGDHMLEMFSDMGTGYLFTVDVLE